MKTIILSALFMAVFMGSGANAQQPVLGDAFFAKYDQSAQALVDQYGAEKIITAYLNGGTYAKYWRISQDNLAVQVNKVRLIAEERGFSSRVTGPENASDMFAEGGNYGTETVAQLKKRGFKSLMIGRMLNGKVDFYEQQLSKLADNIEFGGLYDANSAYFFPLIKKGIQGSHDECCLNLCYPVYTEEDDSYVDQGGDGGGDDGYTYKTTRGSNGDITVDVDIDMSNFGNSDQSQEQEQEQTAPAPAPQQQGSGFVPAQISYQEVPMPMNQPINYNPAPQVNYGNNAGCCNNKPNAVEVIDLFVDVATLGVGIYGANQSWQANHTPPPIFHVTGGNTTYGNNSYNSGAYGNGLLPPYVGHGGGTGTGGGPIDIGNGGPGNH